MFDRARYRAKKLGREFSIKVEDIILPTHCSILGLELNYYNNSQKDDSPSIDRIDPRRGYSKDNIIVVSWRANNLKGNATIEELIRVVMFLADQSYAPA